MKGLLSVNGGYPMVSEGGGYSIILEAEVTQQSVKGGYSMSGKGVVTHWS